MKDIKIVFEPNPNTYVCFNPILKVWQRNEFYRIINETIYTDESEQTEKELELKRIDMLTKLYEDVVTEVHIELGGVIIDTVKGMLSLDENNENLDVALESYLISIFGVYVMEVSQMGKPQRLI